MIDFHSLKSKFKEEARLQGFQDMTVGYPETSAIYPKFEQWLAEGNHGNMSYLARNTSLRQDPTQLHNGTCRILSFRYNYLPAEAKFTRVLKDKTLANVSRYALGKDYHKHLRKKLKKVAESISSIVSQMDNSDLDYRVFVDSAPVLETGLADQSGLGWKGKHTLVIHKEAGSWFFLGEIFVNLPLPIDKSVDNLCGQCSACINLCPTQAIVGPYKVDARRCISYLTIENTGPIPIELRSKMGNRIYGCDDCQLACPWNRYSSTTNDEHFSALNSLDSVSLLDLWGWTENDFLKRFEGSPIRRIGYQNWLRNLAVGIGNSQLGQTAIDRLISTNKKISPMVQEHIDWAINKLESQVPEETKEQKQTQKLIRTIQKMSPRDA